MRSYSLSQLCEQIQDALSMELADTYWVRAEIASLTIRGGHCYLELVEKTDSTGLLSAKVRATCWSNVYKMLSAYFAEETGSALQVGMQVLLEVEVQFHAVYGLSLNICNIDPTYTVGDMARQRAETIARLQQDGVFDLQQSLTLPSLIHRIAVVSSDTAAGYEDFVHQLQASHYAVHTTLFAATMQGDQAERSIIAALRAICEVVEDFDVVVIIRGGGSTTDLTCFDSYDLASHCAQFPLPILSGIGHTRDVSVVDMVVYAALKTPTAVAASIVERFDVASEQLRDWRRRLQMTAERQILIRKHALELLRQRLSMCSPQRIYQMGYSLLTVNGKVVESAQDVKPGQQICTHLQDGVVLSQVLQTNN
ncbi:MAG: exodeoxyribonuclease VII large subunit [Paludibacteraceae bacterium]|nr:exodeoxyribonuclease VII large subunit [Paludibacteraceae bacterium]